MSAYSLRGLNWFDALSADAGVGGMVLQVVLGVLNGSGVALFDDLCDVQRR